MTIDYDETATDLEVAITLIPTLQDFLWFSAKGKPWVKLRQPFIPQDATPAWEPDHGQGMRWSLLHECHRHLNPQDVRMIRPRKLLKNHSGHYQSKILAAYHHLILEGTAARPADFPVP